MISVIIEYNALVDITNNGNVKYTILKKLHEYRDDMLSVMHDNRDIGEYDVFTQDFDNTTIYVTEKNQRQETSIPIVYNEPVNFILNTRIRDSVLDHLFANVENNIVYVQMDDHSKYIIDDDDKFDGYRGISIHYQKKPINLDIDINALKSTSLLLNDTLKRLITSKMYNVRQGTLEPTGGVLNDFLIHKYNTLSDKIYKKYGNGGVSFYLKGGKSIYYNFTEKIKSNQLDIENIKQSGINIDKLFSGSDFDFHLEMSELNMNPNRYVDRYKELFDLLFEECISIVNDFESNSTLRDKVNQECKDLITPRDLMEELKNDIIDLCSKIKHKDQVDYIFENEHTFRVHMEYIDMKQTLIDMIIFYIFIYMYGKNILLGLTSQNHKFRCKSMAHPFYNEHEKTIEYKVNKHTVELFKRNFGIVCPQRKSTYTPFDEVVYTTPSQSNIMSIFVNRTITDKIDEKHEEARSFDLVRIFLHMNMCIELEYIDNATNAINELLYQMDDNSSQIIKALPFQFANLTFKLGAFAPTVSYLFPITARCEIMDVSSPCFYSKERDPSEISTYYNVLKYDINFPVCDLNYMINDLLKTIADVNVDDFNKFNKLQKRCFRILQIITFLCIIRSEIKINGKYLSLAMNKLNSHHGAKNKCVQGVIDTLKMMMQGKNVSEYYLSEPFRFFKGQLNNTIDRCEESKKVYGILPIEDSVNNVFTRIHVLVNDIKRYPPGIYSNIKQTLSNYIYRVDDQDKLITSAYFFVIYVLTVMKHHPHLFEQQLHILTCFYTSDLSRFTNDNSVNIYIDGQYHLYEYRIESEYEVKIQSMKNCNVM